MYSLTSLCNCFRKNYFHQDEIGEKVNTPSVKLDTNNMGKDVVIIKNGRRLCGTGGVFANTHIAQDKAYFEVKIQYLGIWGIGLAKERCDMNVLPLGETDDSWVLRQDGYVYHDGRRLLKLDVEPSEGDIIGITYDHIELKFYLNGESTNAAITGIKGNIYPVFYVDDNAILETHFSKFYHTPPQGFTNLLMEKSLF